MLFSLLLTLLSALCIFLFLFPRLREPQLKIGTALIAVCYLPIERGGAERATERDKPRDIGRGQADCVFPRGERIAPRLRKRLGIAELYALRDKHEFFQIRGRAEYPEHIADRAAAAFKLGPHNAQHNAYLFKQAHAQAQHTRRISAREQQRRRRQDGSDHSHKNAPSGHIFQPSHPGIRRA